LVEEIKNRRVNKKDHDRISAYIRDELGRREGSKSRKNHSNIWKTLDDQISMVPPGTIIKSGNPEEDYHSAIQLGALADALEILAADILRFAFPLDRKWFISHVELTAKMDEEGNQIFDVKRQQIADGVVRSLMTQQHADFGFRDRVKSSVKEGLSHGGIVVEVRTESLNKHIKNGGLQTIRAPVWVPHSMWNCFPDPSPSIHGTDLFYRGSMIIRSYMPRPDFMRSSQYINKDQVPKTNAKPKDDAIEDVELIIYYGDLSLERGDGDMYLPNYKVVIANEILVYAKQNDLPYSPIIYTGYEKDDIRDPYYTSPLIKRSPTQKLATEFMNKAMDTAERQADPPGFYDSYDVTLVRDGGPKTHPGAMTGIKGGSAKVDFMEIGDPGPLFEISRVLLDDISQGTSVDKNRAGVTSSADVTATEIRNNNARGEVRTLDFLGVLDRQGLTPFLHMQHDYNKLELDNYPFFNNQLDTPDFLRMGKSQLPTNIIFEVVGSKQVLGEEQRTQKFLAATQLAAQIPQISERTDWDEVTQEVWNFSGQKDSERFSNQDNDESQAIIQQAQQVIDQMQQQMQELVQQNKITELDKNELEVIIADLNGEIKIMEEQQQLTSDFFNKERKLIQLVHKAQLENVKNSVKTQNKSQDTT